MNKFLFFILFLAISLGYIFDLDKVVAKNFTPFTSLKKLYIDTKTSIKETKDKYFNQTKTIEFLQNENKELKSFKLKYQSAKNELDNLNKNLNHTNATTEQIKFTKVLSYVDFDDYTKIWLDMEKKDDSILGVISDQYAAGIVVNKDNKAKALLNGNEKCNYAIFIGENEAPGIIHASKNGQYLVAKFIPIWFDIKKGDEVITSGMDNIFFKGLKVGRVLSIKKMQDLQEATILPYAKVLKQNSFFVYKKIQKEKEKKETKEVKEEETSNKKP